ncbi:ADP-ribose pyrophosphatase, mitochondrial [Lepeophtheirus salmonis]|uniref:ADP-ribose pyrophosphatase, mitochondrial n=1 Tax=Lepeophtheirus salmonis TaxID=72036 RepID=UPI001AEAC134|nr:ADP-ribose pyrophosphatase, mitochondrial-like [Lepeophtheirus salmonis]
MLSSLFRFTHNQVLKMSRDHHVKCRYPNDYIYRDESGKSRSIVRLKVPNIDCSWDDEFDIYDPITFTAPFVLKAAWADPPLEDRTPKWNSIDGKVDRRSGEGKYRIQGNICLNIKGRTGLRGRGVLGKWGPNHAADPIVTRWKRKEGSNEIEIHPNSGKKVLQFVGIKRKDTGEWALPGGMVDPGEKVSITVRREFMEEAMNSTQGTPEENAQKEKMVERFFSKGVEIYRGYVDDPRNTDNAWMETTAFLFHDEDGKEIAEFDLKAGDDAVDLKWIDISGSIELYASHSDLIRRVVKLKDAHW